MRQMFLCYKISFIQTMFSFSSFHSYINSPLLFPIYYLFDRKANGIVGGVYVYLFLKEVLSLWDGLVRIRKRSLLKQLKLYRFKERIYNALN